MAETNYKNLTSAINNANKSTRKKKSISAWQNEVVEPVPLCKGVEIDTAVYEISENRYITLIIKGFIVYLITAGGMGAYLTALSIDFNQLVFNFVILTTAIICAILYHSWKSENLGYLVFFAVYAFFIFIFRDYINSGFYAVMNDTIDWASIYFDTKGLQYYTERISDRYVTTTIAMSVLGIATNVLLNNYILRRARYVVAIVISLGINLIAFYMQMEPNIIYTIMVLIGIFMTYTLKCGRHYHLCRWDHIFQRSRKGLTYALDHKSLLHGFILVGLYVLSVIAVMSTIYDKTYYDQVQIENKDKEASREIVQNVIALGFFAIINYRPNNGGLSTGELGGVSSITLDYRTDITVIFTPFSRDTLYIRNFIGQEYVPYNNVWQESGEYLEKTNGNYNEVEALKKAYEDGEESSAMGYMTVKNVEAPALSYQPYYSDGDRSAIFLGKSRTYTYYPRLAGNETEVTDEKESFKNYLAVPEVNRDVIRSFIKEAGIKEGSTEDVVLQLKKYYQDNIPYTIRPGATPWRRDFVNHFLEKNRKGYCAHFASAATLIFREMGIPARYCEGYAISYIQVIDEGELVENTEYKDFYNGYSELGETAVVRVDATDADAHAWVEVYDEKMGWTPVEVTPSSGLEEDEDGDFWERFNKLFGDDENDRTSRRDSTNDTNVSFADNFMKYVAYGVIALLILGVFVFVGIKLAPEFVYARNYRRAGLSDKLILKYSRLVKKRKKKDVEFKKQMNYTEQLQFLIPYSESKRNRLIDILDRAGFSNKEISRSDYDFADEAIEDIFAKKK